MEIFEVRARQQGQRGEPAFTLRVEVPLQATFIAPGAAEVTLERGRVAGAGGRASKTAPRSPASIDRTGHRSTHILNRHRAGAGKSGKTEFPARWSDEQLLHHVSEVAIDPKAVRGLGKWDSPYAVGTRDGVKIRVDFFPDNHAKYPGQISTAYPIYVAPNP